MNKNKWIWMPHPAHFICGSDCKFFLSTYVNGYIVSTVGEWFPDAPVREILAKSRGITLQGIGDARRADFLHKCGYEEISLNRKYETMVFKAKKIKRERCCPYEIDLNGNVELDVEGYNNAIDARKGHYSMCEKWDGERD